MLAIATWTALLVPVLMALALRTRLATLWTLPMWSMLPALLLSARGLQTTRNAAAGALAAACAFPLIAILLSPAIAYVIHRDGVPNHATHYRLIAAAVEQAWRDVTPAPLRLFGSDTTIANGAGFYLRGKPLRIDIGGPQDTPWADDARIARDGIALACAAEDAICMYFLARYAGNAARRSEVTLSRRYFGVPDAPVRYAIAIVPPKNESEIVSRGSLSHRHPEVRAALAASLEGRRPGSCPIILRGSLRSRLRMTA